jgi:lactate racemase
MQTLLAYGSHPLPLPAGLEAEVIPPPAPAPVADLDAALGAALAAPIGAPGAPPLGSGATPRTRAVIILSDASRDEPRHALFRAARAALSPVPDERVTIAIANGTHAPGDLARLGLPAALLARHPVVNHDGRAAELLDLGSTARGTRVRVPPSLLEADVVVATGRVKPHYFAGFGGGAKAIFPGLGHTDDIRRNHLLKAEPGARLGVVDGNPCRDDLEEAARFLPAPAHLLNVVEVGGAIIGAVAGDLVAAHRAGVAMARPLCGVRAARADVVIVSAPLPVSASLYQASKLIPPAGLLLEEGGVVIVAAECPDGTGPLAVVNEGIFALGVSRYLPPGASVILVSGMDEATVAKTYGRFAPSLEAATAEAFRIVGKARPRVIVMPDASDLVPEAVG